MLRHFLLATDGSVVAYKAIVLGTGLAKAVGAKVTGYFALPILCDDKLVGKLDAKADRKAGAFTVNAVHRDVEFTKAMTAAVNREIKDLAGWLELELVQ